MKGLRLAFALLLAAAVGVLALRAREGLRVETDLAALVSSDALPALRDVSKGLARQGRLLFAGPDAERVRAAADAFCASNAAARASFDVQKALRALAGRTAGLLSAETRALLLAGKFREVADAAAARLFGPMPPLFSVKDDPFLLATDYVLSLQANLSPGWSLRDGYPVCARDGVHYLLVALETEALPLAAADALRWYIETYRVPGYDEKTRRGLLRHLYIRTNQAGQSLICVLVNGKKLPHEPELVSLLRQAVPETVGVVLGVNTQPTGAILGGEYRTLWGEDVLTDRLCGLTFRLSVPSFYQVNHDMAEVLYRTALDFAGLTGTETVLDLYCGAGTITQVMARRAGRVIGAEIVPAAIADARENARRNGIGNVEFFCGDASAVAADFAARGLRPDVICVDPPRKGLSPDVVSAAARMQPQRIVYVSCDPATLARDVKLFAQEGYGAVRAAAVDMFPGTANIESVVRLERTK